MRFRGAEEEAGAKGGATPLGEEVGVAALPQFQKAAVVAGHPQVAEGVNPRREMVGGVVA